MYDEYLEEAIHVGASGYLVKGAKREELLSAIRRAPDGGFVFGSSIMETDRGVAIALRYLTGQQVWASQLRRESTATNAAVPEQSVQDPNTDSVMEGLPSESQREAGPTAEMTAEMEQTTGELGTPDSKQFRNGEHPEGSSSTEYPDTLQSEVELIFSSLQENGVVLDLYHWIKGLPGAEIVEMTGSRLGQTLLRVDFRQPTPVFRLLDELPFLSEVTEEPYIGFRGALPGEPDHLSEAMAIDAGRTMPKRFRLVSKTGITN